MKPAPAQVPAAPKPKPAIPSPPPRGPLSDDTEELFGCDLMTLFLRAQQFKQTIVGLEPLAKKVAIIQFIMTF